MSSIFGLVATSPNTIDERLQTMKQALGYWGPDASHTCVWNACGMGCHQLYNTPESKNEQLPHTHKEYQLMLTCDARIDNRAEIANHLALTAPEAAAMPDSQMISLLYAKYHQDCVRYLVGDFAFAVWDVAQQTLFCVRDHMGIKPFFYYAHKEMFAFASEKKGIMALPGADLSIDKQFFCNQFFKAHVQAADTTIYQKIRRLPPAHTLTYHLATGVARVAQYWTLDPQHTITFSRKDEYYEGLRAHLETAVRCRLRSAYPVGAELSGGLDSSAITGIASRLLQHEGKPLFTFTNTLGENHPEAASVQGEDERRYAAAVVQFNPNVQATFVTADIWDSMLHETEEQLRMNDGPEMWSAMWLMPVKKAAAANNVRSILSGFPGDEMVTYRGQFYFLDYLDHHQYYKYLKAHNETGFNKLKPFVPQGMELLLHKLLNRYRLRDASLKHLFEYYKLPPQLRFTRGDVAWQEEVYRNRFSSYRHQQAYRLLKPQVGLRMETETRFGYTYKIEPRYPMADIRLTAYYLAMPNELKSEGALSRSAFRRAVTGYLPDMIARREGKIGNIAPFRNTPSQRTEYLATYSRFVNDPANPYIFSHREMLQQFNHPALRRQVLDLLVWFSRNMDKF